MTTETVAVSPTEEQSAAALTGGWAPENDQTENALEWQRFWIRLQQAEWSTLAVVPVDVGIDVHSVATNLVAAGRQAGWQVVSARDARGVTTSAAQEMTSSFGQTSNQRIIVACDPLAENPATLALARAASGVILVARLGESRISAAKLAVDAIGRERIIASVTLERTK